MKTPHKRTLFRSSWSILTLSTLFRCVSVLGQTDDNTGALSSPQNTPTTDPIAEMAQGTNASVLPLVNSSVALANAALSASVATQPTPQLVLQYGGATFQSGTFSATFANDISAPGAVDIQTSDGQHIKATVYGLAYIDFASGKSVLLAQLRPSTGQMLSPTKLLFPDCFDSGISADVEFDVSGNSIEQLVVLRKKIPGPDAFDLPETSRLAVITSFDSPVPAQIPSLIDLRTEKLLLGVPAEDTMQDATLRFGSMRMTAGKAWSMDGQTQPVPVAKNWQTFQGLTDQFLFESAPYTLLRPQLDSLPTASIFHRTGTQSVQEILKHNPAPLTSPRSTKPIEIAKVQPDESHGVVLDWVLVTSTILNINFGGGSKTGPAAIGYGTNDVWNQCATAYQTPYRMYNLVWSDGSNSGVSLEIDNAQGAWGFSNPDPMYANYLYPWMC